MARFAFYARNGWLQEILGALKTQGAIFDFQISTVGEKLSYVQA